MSIRKLALTALTLLLTASLAAAKEKAPVPREIVVVVHAPEAKPLADAEVTLSNPALEPPFTFAGSTDAEGKVSTTLPDGSKSYDLGVKRSGFRDVFQKIDLASQKLRKNEAAQLTITLNPWDAQDFYVQGVELFKAGDFVGAQTKIESAVGLNPSFPKAYTVLSWTYLEQASESWLATQKQQGKLAPSTDIKLTSKSNLEKALSAADQAIAVDPNDVLALTKRYEILDTLGREADADQALATLGERDRTPETAKLFFNSGAAAWRVKNVERARTRFQEALSIDPALYQAHSGLAEVAIFEKDWNLALAELDKVIEQTPRNFKAYERRIDVLLAAERTDEADQAQKALATLKATPSP